MQPPHSHNHTSITRPSNYKHTLDRHAAECCPNPSHSPVTYSHGAPHYPFSGLGGQLDRLRRQPPAVKSTRRDVLYRLQCNRPCKVSATATPPGVTPPRRHCGLIQLPVGELPRVWCRGLNNQDCWGGSTPALPSVLTHSCETAFRVEKFQEEHSEPILMEPSSRKQILKNIDFNSIYFLIYNMAAQRNKTFFKHWNDGKLGIQYQNNYKKF
ncbi:uncharacterized protein LOC117286904 [Fukomys damarensis]|uniref:uncharacterized protein LOC117286904 n=1 Tax=Fukomys damarensis TaxID=885580 RepID=UPI0014551977|nr:uncharacterized protein LOC117286904 [Fukomys damarensis]